MTELRKIFRESFEMLFERPQLFLPRLVSTGVSSILIIGFIAGWVNYAQFLLSFPLVAILGAFTPVMVSSMVKNEGGNVLKKGFRDAANLWKSVAGLMLFTLFLAFVNSLPLSLGLMAYYITGNIIFPIIGGIISLIILLTISFGLYFVPISIIENRSFLQSLEDGFSTSKENSREVVLLTLFSLAVLAASSLVTGYLRDIGFAVFFLGRITSAIIGTYLLVISPKYYLERAEE